LDRFDVSIDRDAEVPIGVQLAWALRTRIYDGRFKPGQRLPGLRELAEMLGVNINTVKAVYQRLDKEGLIDSQQGSGTFVAPMRRRPSDVAAIAANAAHEARETGVDPREVAAALYVSPESPAQPSDAAAERRRVLRKQIAVLERAIGEIESEHPGVAPHSTSTRRGTGPALLNVEELEHVRTQLVHRLAAVHGAIDGHLSEPPTEAATAGPVRKRGTAKPKAATAQRRAPKSPKPVRPATAET
jgi:DNA-binding transcriptional regulator YhcF (GntR family)